MSQPVAPFEKLGSFYLGKQYDLDSSQVTDDLLMYEAKDLCTHAVCVGMTGSGKTGLCISLLEEAAIDQIPAICIDPKGDLGNLLLTFPDLQAKDFRPWLQQDQADRKGISLAEHAEQTAALWKDGLKQWDQDGSRIERFKSSVDISIYTPGSNIGLPLTVLSSFGAPPAELLGDDEALSERASGAASGLLGLLGIDADPLASSEHILISKILDHQWRGGNDVSIAELIGLVAKPPFEKIGVLDLDSFMSDANRSKLSMKLNNLLASPRFASWLEGAPLDIDQLMYTDDGKPRLTILSIAHLSDSERMFFVTILLNEMVAWMRRQRGTSSLRAMLYMDEVFGYFPPVSEPPSKKPMMTLLKQARAFGLGVTLATQNPVDLDYKGLSNIGTWFLGRLQTDRDRQRVIDGLQGASDAMGESLDRSEMERILSGLGGRVFLMKNVHEDSPRVFHSRWALSFLSGPLGRAQIAEVMASKKQAIAEPQSEQSGQAEPKETPSDGPPVIPSKVTQKFVAAAKRASSGARLVYRPALLGKASLHYVRKSLEVDLWRDLELTLNCFSEVPATLWTESQDSSGGELDLQETADEEFIFQTPPAALLDERAYKKWADEMEDYCYRHHLLSVFQCDVIDAVAPAGLSEKQARIELTQAAREARDEAVEKLRDKYAAKVASLEKKLKTAEARVDREASQAKAASMQSFINLGSTLFNAFMGNRISRRASSTASSWTRASQQKEDVTRAQEAVDDIREDIEEMESELEQEIEELTAAYEVQNLVLSETKLNPRKGDLGVEPPVLLWTPWQVDANSGIAEPLF